MRDLVIGLLFLNGYSWLRLWRLEEKLNLKRGGKYDLEQLNKAASILARYLRRGLSYCVRLVRRLYVLVKTGLVKVRSLIKGGKK